MSNKRLYIKEEHDIGFIVPLIDDIMMPCNEERNARTLSASDDEEIDLSYIHNIQQSMASTRLTCLLYFVLLCETDCV